MNIELKELPKTHKLYTITDNRNQFDNLPNQTVNVNAHTNVQFTSTDKSINIKAGTPQMGLNDVITVDLDVNETYGATYFSTNPAGVLNCEVGKDTQIADPSNAKTYGKSNVPQDTGHWTYKCPKNGKILVTAQACFKTLVEVVEDWHKLAVYKNRTQVAESFMAWNINADSMPIQATHFTSTPSITKIIDVVE